MWSLGGVIIRTPTEGDVIKREAMYAIQQAVGSTSSVVNWYGSASQRRTLNFILIENENSGNGLATLDSAARDGTSVELIAASVSQGNFRIISISFTRVQALNYSLPVYRCSADLVQV